MIRILDNRKETLMWHRTIHAPLFTVALVVAFVGPPALQNAAGADSSEAETTEARIPIVTFSHKAVEGLEHERGVVRRDPSDVIKAGDTYYVFYSKVVKADLPVNKRHLGGSGYPATIWYASSPDGLKWTERGEAIGLGAAGAWDSFGVFTPNILKHDDKYWLYYTGVCPTPGRSDGKFENNSENDFTAIGVAVSSSPNGPFERPSDKPVLTVGQPRDAFDSYRVDDACLLIRSGKVWLYYKGRSLAHGRSGPRFTRMGVAVADEPTGPFDKLNDGQPVQDSGHEVQIWQHGIGVMSLVSAHGPNGRTLQVAEDGVNFQVIQRGLKNQPNAPGLYRPELTDPQTDPGMPEWGIGMVYGGEPYLRRYDCKWSTPTSSSTPESR